MSANISIYNGAIDFLMKVRDEYLPPSANVRRAAAASFTNELALFETSALLSMVCIPYFCWRYREEPSRHCQIQRIQREREISVSLISAVAAWVFSVIATNNLRTSAQDNRVLKEATKFETNILPHLDPKLQKELKPILERHKENCKYSKMKARNLSILTATSGVSAAGAFVGGILSIPALITTSVIAGFASTTAAVFAYWSNNDKKNTLSSKMIDKLEIASVQLEQEKTALEVSTREAERQRAKVEGEQELPPEPSGLWMEIVNEMNEPTALVGKGDSPID